MMQRQQKALTQVYPLDCELCKDRLRCGAGLAYEEFYRLGLKIRGEECAQMNGGNLIKRSRQDV